MSKLWLGGVLLSLAASSPAPMLPRAIVFHPGEYLGGWTIEPRQPSAGVELELGDTLASAVIEVVPQPDETRELAVEYQVETSLTIMDDGPHVDLVDWRHYTSDWIELERIDASRFRMPEIDSDHELASRFPTYTVDELYQAALAVGGQRWADIAREWPDPDDGRVGVGISTLRIRVVSHAPDGLETLFTLHVRVPMGC